MAEPDPKQRPVWEVPMPPGGWGTPWPQCVELARALPANRWTLVGGLMVHLHSAVAGLDVTRPTADVDIVLHVETGATTISAVTEVLWDLGYALEKSIRAQAPAHRFVRGEEQIDVMVADHAAPRVVPRIGGRRPFQLPGGTQALQRTIDCHISADDGKPVLISIPNALGALVLKGAAYMEDSRDRNRHLEDGAVLAATMSNPLSAARSMKGSDRRRIAALERELSDRRHYSWLMLEEADRTRGMDALRILVSNPDTLPINRLMGR